jgi:hypothetical protein
LADGAALPPGDVVADDVKGVEGVEVLAKVAAIITADAVVITLEASAAG